MKTILSTVASLLVLFATGCSNEQSVSKAPFVNPPLKGVDVPFDDYTFLAENGDTLFHKSGSIILFPPNAFVDANGNLVKGEVTVSYREFADPIDFFVAGISMAYDSVGVSYTFESSAMCDIRAFQNGKTLFVNPQSKPLANLRTYTNDPAHRVYFLDTLQRRWAYKGVDEITDFTDRPADRMAVMEVRPLPVEPVMPLRESHTRPSFTIVVEEGSVPELDAYDQLKFEVSPDDTNYDPRLAAETWEDVSVKRGKKRGTYEVTFSKPNLSVTFLALPVVEEGHYEEAMKTYRKKKREHDELLAKQEEENRKQLEENKRTQVQNEALNTLVALRNKRLSEERRNALEAQLEQQKTQLKSLGGKLDKIKEQENEIARLELELRKQKENAEANIAIRKEIYRTFRLDGFGIWNCDNPCLLEENGALRINAKFVDVNQQDLPLISVSTVYKSFNGLYDNSPLSDFSYPNFVVMPKQENMLLSVYNQQLYFVSYADFSQYEITNNQLVVFKMKTSTQTIRTVEDVRRILEL